MVFDAPAEGPATFAQVQETVFDVSCALSGCHSDSAWPNLSAGQAYDNIVDVESSRGIALVEPGDPVNSYLYLKLLGRRRYRWIPHAPWRAVPDAGRTRNGARLDRKWGSQRLICL